MYDHDFSELNKYTGMFTAGCLFCLAGCYWVLVVIGRTIEAFRNDYRKMNRMDDLED